MIHSFFKRIVDALIIGGHILLVNGFLCSVTYIANRSQIDGSLQAEAHESQKLHNETEDHKSTVRMIRPLVIDF